MTGGASLSRNTLLHIAAIVLLGLIAYSNAFNVPFTFDDERVIVDNVRIRDVSNIPSMFVDIEGVWGSRPLLHATDALNYYAGGLNPSGYHVVNLALHLINGVFLYLLVLGTGRMLGREEDGTRLVALASALVFVLHPLQTEGVTYASSRSVLLAALFTFAGLLVFSRASRSGANRVFHGAGLFVISLLGMASRESFTVFPLLLVMYDFFFVSRFSIKSVLKNYGLHLPAFLGLGYLVYLVMHNTYGPSGSILVGEKGIPPTQYVLTQFNVHWTYLRMLVLPLGQNIDHDYPIAKTLFEFPTIISFAGYAALVAGSVLFARRRPAISFGVLWFLIALAPISFAVAVMGLRLEDVMLEHRVYLPDAGIMVAAVVGCSLLIKKLRPERYRQVAFVCVAVLSVAMIAATYARNSTWSVETRLWEDVVKKSPDKYRGYFNLANMYRKEGNHKRAVELLETCVRLKPDFPDAYNNLGLSYKELGLTDKAIEAFRDALKYDPGYVGSYVNIGNVYFERKLYDKAIGDYKRAVNIKPDYTDAYYNMAMAYYYKGDLAAAIKQYNAALSIKPDSPDIHYDLGMAYLDSGKPDMARSEFETALRLNPGFDAARIRLKQLPPPSSSAPIEVR